MGLVITTLTVGLVARRWRNGTINILIFIIIITFLLVIFNFFIDVISHLIRYSNANSIKMPKSEECEVKAKDTR